MDSAKTIGICPACGNPHPARADTCPTCGEPLTSVARMITSSTARSQRRRLDQNRQLAGDLRKREMSAANDRMASLVEVDERRLESERAVAAETAEKERRAMLLAGGLFVLIAVLSVVVLLSFLF